MYQPALGMGAELLPGGFGLGRVDEIAIVDPRQGAYPIPAGIGAVAGQIREFHVRPGFDLFVNVVGVAAVVEMVVQNAAPGVFDAQTAVIQFQRTIGLNLAEIVAFDRGKVIVIRQVAGVDFLHQIDRSL